MRQRTLFVVAPHSTDPEFRSKMTVVAKVATDFGMTPVWAHVTANDHRAPPGFGALEDADIVLADLSFERPSCYFEVGFAQALGKRVALIAMDGTAIHQVIGRDTLIFYNTISDYENAVRLALSTPAGQFE